MRRMIPALLGLLLIFPAALAAQQTPQKNQELLEAARKAREAKKTAPRAKYVFTNDNIPKSGGLSEVSSTVPAPPPAKAAAGKAAEEETKSEEDRRKEEADWRKKFSETRAKLASAEKELDVLQRETNLNRLQYYSDPNVTLREEYTRSNINKGKAAIDAKKIEIEQLKKALETLEDDLRRAGLPPAWARP